MFAQDNLCFPNSKYVKRTLHIGDILSSLWLIEKNYAENHYPVVLNLLKQDLKPTSAHRPKDVAASVLALSATLNHPTYVISDYGTASPPEKAPANSIAILNIRGAITKYDQFCGESGTLTKADIIDRCMSNPNIKGVVLIHDSGGGQASATEHLSNKIYNASKPVVSFVQGMSASASYWISSAADAVVMEGKMSSVGSIGAYTTVANFVKYYQSIGVDVRDIYAPQSENKNKAWREALSGNDDAMKAELEKLTNFFITAVKTNRAGKYSNNADIFKGSMFYTEDAIKNGLADHEGDLAFAINLCAEMADGLQPRRDKNQTSIFLNQHTTTMKKVTLLATQVALLAAFGAKVEDGKTSVDVDLTDANLQSVNDFIAGLQSKASNAETALTKAQADLQTANQNIESLTTAKTTAEGQVTQLTADLAAANKKVEEFGGQPGSMGAHTKTTQETTNTPVVNPYATSADAELAEMKKKIVQLP